MRMWVFLIAGIGLVVAGASQAQERQLNAHEHGRGTLNIALDGSRLSMELEAPGADIVGFEHRAKTQKQTSAVAAAKKQLAAPQALFQLPASAGCALTDAKVELEGEDHGHDAKDHGRKNHGAKGEHTDDEHSAFRAEYGFECKAPASLTSIGFDYFNAFKGAQKLDVTVITPKGQSKFEVSRAKPRIDFGGIM